MGPFSSKYISGW